MTMKIALLLSVPLVSASVFAAATTQSSNTFGLLRVDSAQKQTIVCVPWVASSATDDLPIKVTDIVKTANLTVGDNLYWYDGAKYWGWVLQKKQESDEKVWVAANIVEEGDVVAASPGAGIQTLARGNAIILVRQNPANPFYLLGQVAKSGAVASEFPAGAYSLLAPPSASATGIDVNSATWANVNVADQIMFTDSAGKSRTLLWNPSAEGGAKWGVFKRTVSAPEGTWKYDVLIAPGCGAWYVNKGENTVTATWGTAN